MLVELHLVNEKQFLTRSVPLRSFLIGSKLHFKQGHRLQCPGIIFALLRTPKDALRNVLHPRRTHWMRQRSYRCRQRFIHRRNQIGRKRGIRKIFHPLRPVRGREGSARRDNLLAGRMFPTCVGYRNKSCSATIIPRHYEMPPMRRAKLQPIHNKIALANPVQFRAWTRRLTSLPAVAAVVTEGQRAARRAAESGSP
jgi:hypothetical protein